MMCLSSGTSSPGLVWGGSGVERGRTSEEKSGGFVTRTWFTIVASRATADSTVTCSTTNASFSSGIMHTVSTTLKVNLAPLIVQLEAPGEWVSAGQQASFRCRVVGSSPPPVVQWWLGGRRLTANAPLTSVGGNVSVSTVRLTPQPGDHKVPLVCKAYSPNLAGSVLQDQLILAVHFVPVATANPSVYNITWFHNGRALRGWAWGVEVNNATLRLLNVTAAMRGLYTCVGSNPEGDGQSNALNLNVEFAPVCAVQKRRHYVVAPGGAVTVSCQVEAYPTGLTFTWALKNDSESSPIRLHSVGREEGLTGHYTLRGIKQKSVEVLCWAQNDAGTQTTPCKLTIYTQGRPGPVKNCSVNSPHGVWVPGATERRDGDGHQTAGQTRLALGTLMQNLTTTSPVFIVSGLLAGREFVLVVRATGEEGMSPPVVLTAFTLTDNAQTVIGLPAGMGDTGSSGIVGATPLSSSGSGGEDNEGSRDISSDGGGEDLWASPGENGMEAVTNEIMGMVSPLVLVLGTSLIALLLIALILVFLVMKFSSRSRQQQQDQAKKCAEVTLEENQLMSLESCRKRESLAEGESGVGEAAAMSGDERILPEDVGIKVSVEEVTTSPIPGFPVGEGLPYAGPVTSLLATHGSRGGATEWSLGSSATLPRPDARWLGRSPVMRGRLPGLRSIDTSLGSTSSICMGASQCGMGGLSGMGTLRYESRTGSFSGACDLSRVATSVGTAMLSSAHLGDITAIGQHSMTVAGVGRGVSVIGIGDFRNMGNLDMTGGVGQTLTSMLPSASTRQPLQTMTGAGDPSRAHSPQPPSGTWDTRL
ncbi:hypothetical protein O3P69_003185 [Scylla paramamosain]|uniref:Ig-like domain-containing protein n=1 Tax=Scylla paramamosain TaxID=85552 RepID=A0AAW0UM63_SCYPA